MNRWDRLMKDMIKHAHDVYEDPTSNKKVKGFILDLTAGISLIFEEIAKLQSEVAAIKAGRDTEDE